MTKINLPLLKAEIEERKKRGELQYEPYSTNENLMAILNDLNSVTKKQSRFKTLSIKISNAFNLLSLKLQTLKSWIINQWNILKAKFPKSKKIDEVSSPVKRMLEIVDYIENRNGMRSTMLNHSSNSRMMINNENKQLLSYHSDTFKKEFMETFKIESEERDQPEAV